MSRHRRNDLPIILSHNTRTGIMIYPNRKMGGRDVLIVGLNREIPSGKSFGLEDIEWTKAILHILDVESLQITIDCLTEELKRWRKEGGGMTKGRALAIFENIENASVSIEEKGEAIYIVMNMEDHNAVRKASMLKVIRWLWDRAFEIKQEAKDE